MDDDALRDVIFRTLGGIAPEVDPAELTAGQPLRDQVDLDSMDWLHFIVGLHESLKVDIPEADYQKLRTLDDLVGYLGKKLAQ